MKIMVIGFVLMICIYGASAYGAEYLVPKECSYLSSDVIRNWIDETPSGLPKGDWEPEGIWFVEIALYRSGDCFALGIVNTYTQKELLDPDRLGQVLRLIRVSFSRPRDIERPKDKDPAATMRLLSALEQGCRDVKRKEKITDTQKYILSQIANEPKAGNNK
jgi:hypothetical protein